MITVTHPECYISEKIVDVPTLVDKVNQYKKDNKKVGLCVGSFDLLHAGHMNHFRSAKKICDLLCVGVTSDIFVSERKKDGRPIFPDFIRAFMISQLVSVDYVIISNYKTASELIKLIKPTYYIKGPDYKNKFTPGIELERATVSQVGGEIRYTDDEKMSSTEIIGYIKNNIE
jgi:D-glycero-beta-D-manno-heptose 1-phosphate adenylyltransferase